MSVWNFFVQAKHTLGALAEELSGVCGGGLSDKSRFLQKLYTSGNERVQVFRPKPKSRSIRPDSPGKLFIDDTARANLDHDFPDTARRCVTEGIKNVVEGWYYVKQDVVKEGGPQWYHLTVNIGEATFPSGEFSLKKLGPDVFAVPVEFVWKRRPKDRRPLVVCQHAYRLQAASMRPFETKRKSIFLPDGNWQGNLRERFFHFGNQYWTGATPLDQRGVESAHLAALGLLKESLGDDVEKPTVYSVG